MQKICSEDFAVIKHVILSNFDKFTTLFSIDQTVIDDRLHQDGIICQKNNIEVNVYVKKAAGGFINNVYMLGQKYILKIQSLIQGVTTHQIQLMKLTQMHNVKAPKYINHGQIYGKKYILMTQIKGNKLTKYWPLLEQIQREKAIQQVCFQMKKLHSIKFQTYSPRRPYQFANMQQAIYWYIDSQIQQRMTQLKQKQNQSARALQYVYYLKNFLDQNIKIFQLQQKNPVLVHNDLHMNNILYDINTKQVTGIVDFDFARQSNKDYQLRQIVMFLDNPQKYVEQQYRHLWQLNQCKATNQIKYFRKYYPELFQDSHHDIVTRLKVYLIEENLELSNQEQIAKFEDYYIKNSLAKYFTQL